MRSKAGTKATDKASFEDVIDGVEVMVAILTGSIRRGEEFSNYFMSGPCQYELSRAQENSTPVVFILESAPELQLEPAKSLPSHCGLAFRCVPPALIPFVLNGHSRFAAWRHLARSSSARVSSTPAASARYEQNYRVAQSPGLPGRQPQAHSAGSAARTRTGACKRRDVPATRNCSRAAAPSPHFSRRLVSLVCQRS